MVEDCSPSKESKHGVRRQMRALLSSQQAELQEYILAQHEKLLIKINEIDDSQLWPSTRSSKEHHAPPIGLDAAAAVVSSSICVQETHISEDAKIRLSLADMENNDNAFIDISQSQTGRNGLTSRPPSQVSERSRPSGGQSGIRSSVIRVAETVEKEVKSANKRGELLFHEAQQSSFSAWTQKLDVCIGVVIILNSIVVIVQLDWQGYLQGVALGVQVDNGAWLNADYNFFVIEHVFNAIYVAEVCFRLALFRSAYFKDLMNGFDFSIVFISCVDLYIMQPLEASVAADVRVLRYVRLLKVARALRIVRTLTLFTELRVLVRTIYSCTRALTTSMTLLGLMMLISGILTCQFLHSFIQDENEDLEMRLWVYRHYGDAYRATYTFFEATLSGCWPNYFRPIIEQVSVYFVVFFIIYVSLVIFAVIRIITALFLQETFHIASSDAEMVALSALSKKKDMCAKLRRFFNEADVSGDNFISCEELVAAVQKPMVKSWLNVLGLETFETEQLFHLLDDGDGLISVDEFINGIGRLKGGSRAIESVAMQKDLSKIRELQEQLVGLVRTVVATKDAPYTL